MMSHHEKVQSALTYLGRFGVRPGSVAPPIYRLLWRLGSEMPPPYFQGFIALNVMTFANFIVIFGALTWLWSWRAPHLPGWVTWSLPPAAGLFFGVLLAAAYKISARLLKLPDWKDYPTADGMAIERPVSPWIKCDVWVRLLLGVAVVAMLIAAAVPLP